MASPARRRWAWLAVALPALPACSLLVSTSGLTGGTTPADDAGLAADATPLPSGVDSSTSPDASVPADATSVDTVSSADSAPSVDGSFVDAAADGSGCAAITRKLVAHWPMTPATISGTTALDTSGNGANGTLNGFPAIEPQSAAAPIGSALVFPTSGQAYLDVPTLALDTSAGGVNTVVMWVYRPGPNVDVNDVLTLLPNSPRYDLWLTYGLADAGADTFLCFDTQHNDCFGIRASNLLDRWVHIVAEFANGAITGDALFVDGAPVTSTCRTADGFNPCTYSATAAAPFDLGGITDFAYHGMVSDVRVYARALGQPEVTVLYGGTTCP